MVQSEFESEIVVLADGDSVSFHLSPPSPVHESMTNEEGSSTRIEPERPADDDWADLWAFSKQTKKTKKSKKGKRASIFDWGDTDAEDKSKDPVITEPPTVTPCSPTGKNDAAEDDIWSFARWSKKTNNGAQAVDEAKKSICDATENDTAVHADVTADTLGNMDEKGCVDVDRPTPLDTDSVKRALQSPQQAPPVWQYQTASREESISLSPKVPTEETVTPRASIRAADVSDNIRGRNRATIRSRSRSRSVSAKSHSRSRSRSRSISTRSGSISHPAYKRSYHYPQYYDDSTDLSAGSAYDLCCTIPETHRQLISRVGEALVYLEPWNKQVYASYRPFYSGDFLHYFPLIRDAKVGRWYTWPEETVLAPLIEDDIWPMKSGSKVTNQRTKLLPILHPTPKSAKLPFICIGNALCDFEADKPLCKLNRKTTSVFTEEDKPIYYFSIQSAVHESGVDSEYYPLPPPLDFNVGSRSTKFEIADREPHKGERIFRVVCSTSRAHAASTAFYDAGEHGYSTLFTVAIPAEIGHVNNWNRGKSANEYLSDDWRNVSSYSAFFSKKVIGAVTRDGFRVVMY